MTPPTVPQYHPSALPDDLRGGAVALGNFDGVHRGHQELLRRAVVWARERSKPALLLTFEPHPRRLFKPDDPFFPLTPPDLKAERAAHAGIDAVVICPFDAALAAMTAETFCHDLLAGQLRAGHIITGRDFHFGKGRDGDIAALARHGLTHGFSTEAADPVMDGASAISSTRIRARLTVGDVAAANRMLGWEWSLTAEVRHGDKRGRELGYPTANLSLPPDITLAHGIYAVRATVNGETHKAVASFGRRPTFDGGVPKLEVHLFDFRGDLYGRDLRVTFVGYIRPELKFDSIAALIARMDQDSLTARQMLAG